MLNSHVPCQVVGDGNCLFRAVSRAIYGHEDEHCRLRLFAALEILKNHELYDPELITFGEYIINFNADCTSTYFDIIEEVSTLGGFTGLIHMYALSAVLEQPIESYYSPCSYHFSGIQCFNRVVYGRNVRHKAPIAIIMWSKAIFDENETFTPNHFVPLFKQNENLLITIREEGENICNLVEDKAGLRLGVSIPLSFPGKPLSSDYQTSLDQSFIGERTESEEVVHDEGINEVTGISFGTPLFNSKFLDITEVIGILKSPTMIHTSILNGIKNNVYFLVDETENLERAPIFLGPLYLHTNSTFSDFLPFFSCLAGKLKDTNTDNSIISSEEEQALVRAITFNFPRSNYLLCTRRLRQNFDDQLKKKTGLCEEDRKSFLNDRIFGSRGLIMSETLEIFQQRVENNAEFISNNCSNFLDYYSTRVVPSLRQNIKICMKGGISLKLTKNNCESINHLIKHLINHKPQPVHTLLNILISHVKTQYSDLEKSLYGRGNYSLNSQFYNFRIEYNQYLEETEAEMKSYYLKFLKFNNKKEDREVCSSDGILISRKNPWAGKKPGVKERKKKSRTDPAKKN